MRYFFFGCHVFGTMCGGPPWKLSTKIRFFLCSATIVIHAHTKTRRHHAIVLQYKCNLGRHQNAYTHHTQNGVYMLSIFFIHTRSSVPFNTRTQIFQLQTDVTIEKRAHERWKNIHWQWHKWSAGDAFCTHYVPPIAWLLCVCVCVNRALILNGAHITTHIQLHIENAHPIWIK